MSTDPTLVVVAGVVLPFSPSFTFRHSCVKPCETATLDHVADYIQEVGR